MYIIAKLCGTQVKGEFASLQELQAYELLFLFSL